MSLTGKARTIGWHEHRCDDCGGCFWNTSATSQLFERCGDCLYRDQQRAIQSNELEMWGANTRSALR